MPWFIPILIGLALTALSYLIMPKPKQAQPAAAQPLDSPTASAGQAVPKVFGTMTIQSPNILGFWDKGMSTRNVSTS